MLKRILLLSWIPLNMFYFYITDIVPTKVEALILVNLIIITFILAIGEKE